MLYFLRKIHNNLNEKFEYLSNIWVFEIAQIIKEKSAFKALTLSEQRQLITKIDVILSNRLSSAFLNDIEQFTQRIAEFI